MPHLNADSCEIREGFWSRFSACKEKPVGRCIYCARAFCATHGELRDDGEEICGRKNCVAKRDDLARHLQYVAVVTGFNEAGACGQPGCQNPPDGQCGRCRAFFCLRHLDTRDETVTRNGGRIARMATLCAHCWARRPIWNRR